MGERYAWTEGIWDATSTTGRRAMDPPRLKIDPVVAGNTEMAGDFGVARN